MRPWTRKACRIMAGVASHGFEALMLVLLRFQSDWILEREALCFRISPNSNPLNARGMIRFLPGRPCKKGPQMLCKWNPQ